MAVETTGKSKHLYLEILRIIAIFEVLYNHSDVRGWTQYVHLQGFDRAISLILASICKIAVPLFLMISGATLLGKEESIRTLYKKRVLRFVILIAFVSIGNYLYFGFTQGFTISIKNFLISSYSSYSFCTYFLWLYLGLMVSLPLLRRLGRNMSLKEVTYGLILSYVFWCILPSVEFALGIGPNNLQSYVGILSGGIFYPVIGYHLSRLDEKYYTRKNMLILGALSILCIALQSLVRYWNFMKTGADAELFSYYATIPAIFVFVAAQFICKKYTLPNWLKTAILKTSPNVLGIFLLSVIIMTVFGPIYNFMNIYLPAPIACAIWITASVVVCGIITAVLRLIPPIRKLL